MLKSTLLIALALCLANTAKAQESGDIHTRGWVEHARLMPCGLLLEAKLDSGARTTSLHAEILPAERAIEAVPNDRIPALFSELEQGVTRWLAGSVADKNIPDDPPPAEVSPMTDHATESLMPETVTFRLSNGTDKEIIFTEPVTRWVSIRRRGGGAIVRPVIMMDLCVGGRRVRGEVNLADRSGFNYPLLIGRNMLGEAAITVDSRRIYASPTACPDSA